MPGGRSSHASKRAQQALNRPTYGGGNKKIRFANTCWISSYVKTIRK